MSLIGSVFSTIGNIGATSMTNSMNKKIADQNLAFQQENLEYQKALQQQIFNREDTAYQRKVNDLVAAGLNPALASSGAGSGAGSIVSTSAPQNTMNYKAPSIVSLGSVLDTLSSIQQIKNMQVQMQNARKQGNYIDALTSKANAEATGITFNNGILSKTQEDKIKSITYQTDMLQKQKEMLDRQAELNRISYNFSLGNSVMNNFKSSNAPFLRELQLKQDMQQLQYQNLQESLKSKKNNNNAFWWNFGLDSFSKLLNSFSGALGNGIDAYKLLMGKSHFGF